MEQNTKRVSLGLVEGDTGVSVNSLRKTFQLQESTVQALADLTLVSPYKKVLTLLGPSGCGKTTLLRCIAGLETPDAGEIQIGDALVFSSTRKLFLPPNKRGISMVFQSYAIWPHMTVFHNVAYPLEVQKVPKAEIKRRVRETLARVRLSGFEERPATKLSGGQQQRVALARAMIARPRVLLFDEPLSNLDAKLREEARKELRGFLTELGISAIYVTHDRLEALTISDVIAVMNAGRIVEIGAPKKMYYEASHKFVVSFIGDVNFIDGEITGRAANLGFIKSPLGEIACETELPVGTRGTLALRPEIFELVPDNFEQEQNVFRGEITQLLFTGEAYEVEVIVEGIQLSARLSPFTEVQRGDIISLFAAPERCRFIPEQ